MRITFILKAVSGSSRTRIIFEAHWWNERDTSKYFQADVSQDENEKIIFSNVVEVEIKAVATAKDEMRKLEESDTADHKKLIALNETFVAEVHLSPVNEASRGNKKKRTGRVDQAQIADKLNENGRYYPGPVLDEAVTYAQKRIEEEGYLLMDSQHRINARGEPENNLRETVAVIKSINYDKETGIVSLPEIEFVETQGG